MNLVNLDVERKRRQMNQANKVVARMASALLHTYAVSSELQLSIYLGFEERLSNEEAIVRWIQRVLLTVDQDIADKVFPLLCDRFQTQLSRLPQHLHGGGA